MHIMYANPKKIIKKSLCESYPAALRVLISKSVAGVFTYNLIELYNNVAIMFFPLFLIMFTIMLYDTKFSIGKLDPVLL